MKKLNLLICLFIVATFCENASANARDKYIGVDLRDVANYAAEKFPEARLIINSMKRKPQNFFGPNAKDIQKIYGIELYDVVRASSDGITLPIVVFAQLASEHYYFRKLDVNVKDGEVTDLKMNAEDVDIDKVHFKVRVGIYQRKVILEDEANQIKIIYPLGLGGVNDIAEPSKVRFSTPQMTGAFLEKKNVIAKRIKPAYYKGMPFLDISHPEGHPTEIAFHIEINDRFRRSFESHGCMRLRQKDLLEFFALVMHSPEALPVEILLDLPTGGDHPFPVHNSSYEHYKNFGTRDNPITKRSKIDHLVIMETVYATPPWLKEDGGGHFSATQEYALSY